MDNATSGFNATPQAARMHIALYGRRNVGKSSLINALTGQPVALVADVPGTTTDPVRKAMELHPLGPIVLIDTAGFDDEGTVGILRNQRTREVLAQTDLALLIVDGGPHDEDVAWLRQLQQQEIPVVVTLNKVDLLADPAKTAQQVVRRLGVEPVLVSAARGEGIDALRSAIVSAAPQAAAERSITGEHVKPGDSVLLVMPQDRQAPKGRLILPQVQTIRDLLDNGCTITCCTPDQLEHTLNLLREPPALIITDSQVFDLVAKFCPTETRLTSFSILMAAWKGDLQALIDGAKAIDRLTPQSRVLIAEACTHAPLSEDIGREKIPALLRKRVGESLQVDIVAGRDFPADLTGYDLVIHCGACMFNRRYMLSRIAQAQAQGVPITNYGITIAHVKGILEQCMSPLPPKGGVLSRRAEAKGSSRW